MGQHNHRPRPRNRQASDSCPVASRLSGRCATLRVCGASDRHDVSTTELHHRLERGARERQWLIGERVKNLFTKDVYGPRTLYVNTQIRISCASKE
jgi:hypothetical protein